MRLLADESIDGPIVAGLRPESIQKHARRIRRSFTVITPGTVRIRRRIP